MNFTDQAIKRIALLHIEATVNPELAWVDSAEFRFFRDKIRLFLDYDPDSLIVERSENGVINGTLVYTWDEPAFNRFCSPTHLRFWIRTFKTLLGYYGCDFAKFVKAGLSMLGRAGKRLDEGLELPNRYGKIWVLLVAKEARGKGVAKRLLEKCVNAGRERGVETLVVTVKTDNAPAIRVYERAGFKRVGTCEESSGASYLMTLNL